MLLLSLENGVLSFVLSILMWSVTALFSYLLLLSIYRIYLHPLSKYPGPFLAKITDWYSVYHAWKGDRHLEFWRCHETYGPIVRFGPNSLSINTNTALKTIYGHRANVQKSQFYSVFPPTKDTANTHSSIDKSNHARKRRVLSHAFSDGAIKSMEKYILANVRTFCSRLGPPPTFSEKQVGEKGWGVAQNMALWCNYLAFDVMGDLCFGKAFEMLESEKNHRVIDLMENAAHMHLILGTNPMIKTLGLNKVLFSKIYNMRMEYMAYSKGQAAERTKIGLDSDRKDFFFHLLNARDPETGNGFTGPELWGESNLLIIAGSDTTSTALAAAFFYLTHSPATLQKLTAEVRSTFSDVEDICAGQTLSSCIYLRAVIDEAMRLSPPVGGILPREILPGGLDIDGLSLPAGTVVGTPHYAIHHNPDYYPLPFEFRPERWIEGSSPEVTRESVALAHSAFCPFSIGPRGCIGKGLAYTELMTGLARIVFLYDMKLAEGVTIGEGHPDNEWGRQKSGEYQLRDSFTSLKDGPYVHFRARAQ
ncbi:putative cytochrome P450 67 [Venustampulla echinocandica]|uniref:Putative cytochrome P450 67 n=1 Tax=Venustampulla echinocandica TaxID=2656787 RepID=A0A370TT62_9HELO|nr:putative cytochrome P450 67 [Venustampulla echinocandica]RDL38715.1 putative cytochrome P450 67 [Venustampulla echinocandica]